MHNLCIERKWIDIENMCDIYVGRKLERKRKTKWMPVTRFSIVHKIMCKKKEMLEIVTSGLLCVLPYFYYNLLPIVNTYRTMISGVPTLEIQNLCSDIILIIMLIGTFIYLYWFELRTYCWKMEQDFRSPGKKHFVS